MWIWWWDRTGSKKQLVSVGGAMFVAWLAVMVVGVVITLIIKRWR